jgi:hypothetical protein
MPSYGYLDLFDPAGVDVALGRLAALTAESPPQWGSMNAAQMLAHLCVAYDMAFDRNYPRPNPLMRWALRRFVKDKVVGPAPYPRNTPTAPQFRIRDPRNFAQERARLEANLRRALTDGRAAFEGRESPSFGPLSANEWNVLFAKHLDHHLRQFGV